MTVGPNSAPRTMGERGYLGNYRFTGDYCFTSINNTIINNTYVKFGNLSYDGILSDKEQREILRKQYNEDTRVFNLFQKLGSIYDCTNLNITSDLVRILCSCASFQIRLPPHAHLSTLSELGQTGVIRCYFWARSALTADIR